MNGESGRLIVPEIGARISSELQKWLSIPKWPKMLLTSPDLDGFLLATDTSSIGELKRAERGAPLISGGQWELGVTNAF